MPGETGRELVASSASEKLSLPLVKSNVAGSPSGRVCCATMIRPFLVFVNVQVTVSPGATRYVAVPAVVSPVLLVSSQVRPVRFQSALAVSVAV